MTREEFVQQVEGEQQRLRRVLLALCCGDAMQADEVAQEALLKAYVSMNRFEGGSFWAWIYKIAFRTYLDMRRTPAHATLSIQAAADIADSHTQADVGFRYQALHAALEQLPPRERMATLMHYINGYSIREIAQITDCTEAAVKQQLSRGRTHLKTLLTK